MAEYPVHLGHWTDWSKGPVLGSQVTVSTSSSNILIALIATFITLVGGVAWTTVAYTLHQIRATRQDTDGLHHSQQVLLRNATSPLSFASKVAQVGFAWRKSSRKGLFSRTWSLVVLAVSVYAVFIIAGVLLSLLATTGDVLLQSPHCMVRNTSIADSLSAEEFETFLAALGAWVQQESQLVLAYAQQCYPTASQTGSTGAAVIASRAAVSNCNFYTKPSLNWTTSFPGVCPFNEGVCAGPSSDIIQFDTGYLDTNFDLGINDKEENRLQVRKVTTCAPIDTTRYSSPGFVNSLIGTVATYNFGSNSLLPGILPQVAAEVGPNVTFIYPYASYFSQSQAYYIQTASTVSLGSSANGSTFPTFNPLPDFAANDHRPISLFFLANRALFMQPVEDPWFNATEELDLNNATYFYSSQPGAVLGCVDDIEFCNPTLSSNQCMNVNEILYTGLYNVYNISESNISVVLELNQHQQSLAGELSSSLTISIMAPLIKYLGPYALSAKDYLLNGETDIVSSMLSSQQWQVELQRFQAISLAGLQRSRFSFAAGPSDPELLQYFIPYESDLSWICSSQKFRNTDYFSYSILGIGLIFGLGGMIILASVILTTLVPAIQLRTGKGIHRRDQWFANDALFLQASLYDAKGHGVWTTDPINKVPKTHRDEKFAAYTSSVVNHFPDRKSQAHTKASQSIWRFAAGSQSCVSKNTTGLDPVCASQSPKSSMSQSTVCRSQAGRQMSASTAATYSDSAPPAESQPAVISATSLIAQLTRPSSGLGTRSQSPVPEDRLLDSLAPHLP